MRRSQSIKRETVLKLLAACSVTGALLFGGTACEIKSFIDPGEVGRYEHEPLLLPILHKLDTGIDEPNDAFANASDPLPSDLVFTAQAYILGPGDTVSVNIAELAGNGQPEARNLRISDAGTLNLPLLSEELKVVGFTETQVQRAIKQAYKDAKLFNDANVTVTVLDSRSRVYSLGGGFANPGEFQITKKDFRLLDALITGRYAAGGGVDYVYILRREDVKTDETPPSGMTPSGGSTTSPSGGMSGGPATMPSGPTTSPGPDILAPHASRIDLLAPKFLQVPANPIVPPAPGVPTSPGSPPNPSTPTAQGTPGTPGTPPIPGIVPPSSVIPGTPPPGAATQPGGYEGRYIIIDGKPVLVGGTLPGNQPANGGTGGGFNGGMNGGMTPTSGQDPLVNGFAGVATQPSTGPSSQATSEPFAFQDLTPSSGERVIRIPLAQVRNFDTRYNIVIRPSDIIMLPDPIAGYYYMGGHVARTGAYSLVGTNVTLKAAVISAGMLDQVAIPQRCDIIRRIGADKEVFARVNLADIFEGKQPDLFLKPNDEVMVGTNFLAPFIAAVRNGFRFSYGFGFFYDKNFNDSNNNNNN